MSSDKVVYFANSIQSARSIQSQRTKRTQNSILYNKTGPISEKNIKFRFHLNFHNIVSQIPDFFVDKPLILNIGWLLNCWSRMLQDLLKNSDKRNQMAQEFFRKFSKFPLPSTTLTKFRTENLHFFRNFWIPVGIFSAE